MRAGMSLILPLSRDLIRRESGRVWVLSVPAGRSSRSDGARSCERVPSCGWQAASWCSVGMSDQKSSPTDEMALRDLLMALKRHLPPSAPASGSSPPAGVEPSSVHEGVLGGTDRALRPAPALDPQAKAFGAQLDVLLIEASLRLQAQVTMVRPLTAPHDVRETPARGMVPAPVAHPLARQPARWAAKEARWVALAGGVFLLAVLTFRGGTAGAARRGVGGGRQFSTGGGQDKDASGSGLILDPQG